MKEVKTACGEQQGQAQEYTAVVHTEFGLLEDNAKALPVQHAHPGRTAVHHWSNVQLTNE